MTCRDSDKMIGFIASRSRRAERGEESVIQRLLVTRYDPLRAAKDETLSLEDISELLGLPLLVSTRSICYLEGDISLCGCGNIGH